MEVKLLNIVYHTSKLKKQGPHRLGAQYKNVEMDISNRYTSIGTGE